WNRLLRADRLWLQRPWQTPPPSHTAHNHHVRLPWSRPFGLWRIHHHWRRWWWGRRRWRRPDHKPIHPHRHRYRHHYQFHYRQHHARFHPHRSVAGSTQTEPAPAGTRRPGLLFALNQLSAQRSLSPLRREALVQAVLNRLFAARKSIGRPAPPRSSRELPRANRTHSADRIRVSRPPREPDESTLPRCPASIAGCTTTPEALPSNEAKEHRLGQRGGATRAGLTTLAPREKMGLQTAVPKPGMLHTAAVPAQNRPGARRSLLAAAVTASTHTPSIRLRWTDQAAHTRS